MKFLALISLIIIIFLLPHQGSTEESSFSTLAPPPPLANFENRSSTDKCILNETTLFCLNCKSFRAWYLSVHNKIIKSVTHLIIDDWENTTLRTSQIAKFSNLREFIVETGNITEVIGDFPFMKRLRKIDLSQNCINVVHPNMFRNLPALVTVDLRGNDLETIAEPFKFGPQFENLFLLGNQWDCTKTMKWLLLAEHASRIADLQSLKCFDRKYYSRPICTVMEYKKIVKETCRNSELKNCSCHIYYIQKDGISYAPFYMVNCSNRGFERLPRSLPVNTSVLYIDHNNIRDLRPLIENDIYLKVDDIYLDFNRVETINVLGESSFWYNFRLLSLMGNKLAKISIFKMSKAFQINQNIQGVYLSDNPWICDCAFTPRFQKLLMQYESLILDSKNVTCKQERENAFSGAQIKSLTLSDLCLQTEDTNIFNIVNIVMIVLICLILSKLGYDYYFYKIYGRVPWIVTKLP